MAKRKLAGELITSQSIPRPWLRPRWFAAAPTREQAKRIWWDDLKALVPKRIVRDIRESDLCIVANNGAELWVIGLDRPQRMEGVSWDGGCVDEFADCFVAGTLVDTPHGGVAIEKLRVGDAVKNAAGVGIITSLIRKQAKSLAVVRLQSYTMACSVTHKFFTQRGWVEARSLEPHDRLVSQEQAVCLVQQGVCCHMGRGSQKVLRQVLLGDMENDSSICKGEGVQSARESQSRNYAPPNAKKQSRTCETNGGQTQCQPLDENARGEGAPISRAEGHGAQTQNTGRKRIGPVGAAAIALGSTGASVCCGVAGAIRPRCQQRGAASTLRNRHCGAKHQTSNRSRWSEPQLAEEAGGGREEGPYTGKSRVVCVEVYESGSGGFLEHSGGKDFVDLYDIEVSRHPSYSVGGFLVHNCKPGIFDAHIRPAIADRQGWCWLLGVPDRDAPGQVEYRDRYDRILAGAEPEWAVYHWPSADILPPEEVESARRSMDPELFRQEFLGEFVLAGGMAFGDFDPVIHVRECKYDPALPVAWALDFNVNPMCSGVMQRKDGRAYVLHEFALADTNTETACTAFLEWATANKVNLKGVGIYGDASGGARKTSSSATDWEIVRSHLRNYSPRFLVPRANHPIKDTLNSVRAKLRNADGEASLFIDPQAKVLIKDLRSLLWPSDLSDGHAAAWLRYYIHTEFPVRGGAAGPIIGGRVLA